MDQNERNRNRDMTALLSQEGEATSSLDGSFPREAACIIPDEESANNATSAVEKAIETMELSDGLLVHPVHWHSFAQISFFSLIPKQCSGCQDDLKRSWGSSSEKQEKGVVKCMACGVLAHRSCAMEKDAWEGKRCAINRERLEVKKKSDQNVDNASNESTDGVAHCASLLSIRTPSRKKCITAPNVLVNQNASQVFDGAEALAETTDRKENDSEIRPNHFLPVTYKEDTTSFLQDEEEQKWTDDGPPPHWAMSSPDTMVGILKQQKAEEKEPPQQIEPTPQLEETETGVEIETRAETETGAETEADADSDEFLHYAGLHYAQHPFAVVSRALHENVFAHFARSQGNYWQESDDAKVDEMQQGNVQQENEEEDKIDLIADEQNESPIQTMNVPHNEDPIHLKTLLTEVEPDRPSDPHESTSTLAGDTASAVKSVAGTRVRLGLAAVAGGIAGGVAGLCLAGPAGAVIGSKLGQTAGIIGVVVESSVNVGIVIAGVAAAGFGATQAIQATEKRILTIGEDGVERKVMLVRPNVTVDPVWAVVASEARRTAPSKGNLLGFGLIPNAASEATKAKRNRNLRDADIVETDEREINTEEKVLLLVSRSLNDKFSLPGHVYRYLMKFLRERADGQSKEGALQKKQQNSVQGGSDLPIPSRERRQDAHGLIKQVTATLLEVRPGFAASPAITEMSATAVEGLVFGEIYDLVFEEIMEETHEKDAALMDKIVEFELKQVRVDDEKKTNDGVFGSLSQTAIKALRMLPDEHSAVDKLRSCVRFLEQISEHFSLQDKSKGVKTLCADSMLKMVCQHVIAAKVPTINAEILFLEEFARDEHLLRGKEGYSLVTLQASLHFLNASTDFKEDIFQQENDD